MNKTAFLHARCTEGEKKALYRLAEEAGLKPSEMLRQLVRYGSQVFDSYTQHLHARILEEHHRQAQET